MNVTRKMFLNGLAAVAMAAAVAVIGVPNASAAKSAGIRLKAKLTGPAIGTVTPSGEAEFKANPARLTSSLDVEVEHVNLPVGTVLTVVVTHSGTPVAAGTIKLKAGENELELESQEGDKVPAVVAGDTISVMNGAATILTGAF